MAQHAHSKSIDQGVALVNRIKIGLAADVGQAETVAVEADAAHHSVHHACRVGVVDGAKAQLIHHGNGPSAHRDDVAHDSADARGRALERLDVAGVVVTLHLERHGPSLADVDDAGVLPHAHHEALAHLGCHLLAKLAQVDLGRLIRAVLAPHHRVHGQLARGGATTQNLANLGVLVGLEPQRSERLLFLRRGDGVGHRVGNVSAHG